MPRLSVTYRSECLIRDTRVEIYLPEGMKNTREGMRTLILLHGYTGSAENWVGEELANKYNFAIVCPNGENGFWLNGLCTGHRYQDLLGEELITFLRATFGLAMKKEDTFIMGLSMGGFGALHTALAYPDTFGTAACLSSALIWYNIAHMAPDFKDGIANYEYYRECFGDLNALDTSLNNPEVQIRKLLKKGTPLPRLYLCCGSEDFLIEPNRKFIAFLKENKIEHSYFEGTGVHDMNYWQNAVHKLVPVMFGKEE